MRSQNLFSTCLMSRMSGQKGKGRPVGRGVPWQRPVPDWTTPQSTGSTYQRPRLDINDREEAAPENLYFRDTETRQTCNVFESRLNAPTCPEPVSRPYDIDPEGIPYPDPYRSFTWPGSEEEAKRLQETAYQVMSGMFQGEHHLEYSGWERGNSIPIARTWMLPQEPAYLVTPPTFDHCLRRLRNLDPNRERVLVQLILGQRSEKPEVSTCWWQICNMNTIVPERFLQTAGPLGKLNVTAFLRKQASDSTWIAKWPYLLQTEKSLEIRPYVPAKNHSECYLPVILDALDVTRFAHPEGFWLRTEHWEATYVLRYRQGFQWEPAFANLDPGTRSTVLHALHVRWFLLHCAYLENWPREKVTSGELQGFRLWFNTAALFYPEGPAEDIACLCSFSCVNCSPYESQIRKQKPGRGRIVVAPSCGIREYRYWHFRWCVEGLFDLRSFPGVMYKVQPSERAVYSNYAVLMYHLSLLNSLFALLVSKNANLNDFSSLTWKDCMPFWSKDFLAYLAYEVTRAPVFEDPTPEIYLPGGKSLGTARPIASPYPWQSRGHRSSFQ